MVVTAEEDKGRWAARDGGRWWLNGDSKGSTTDQTLKRADNALGLTMSQTSKGVEDR